MKPFTSSIRRHLLSWLLIPITALCLLGGCITYFLAVNFATDAYDASLLDCAHTVSSRLEFRSSSLHVDLPPAALAILRHDDKDSFYYQVISSQNQIINGDIYIPAPSKEDLKDLPQEPIYYDGYIQDRPVRVAAIEVPAPNKKDYIIIKVAETISGRTQLIQNIILGVVVPQLLLILLAAGAVWLGVTRGLFPLQVLKDAVESRNPSDLRLLSEDNVPKEVKPLVTAINRLLSRVEEDREAQKRFVSNAAHQLRTPLAGLKTQTELALREQDPKSLQGSLKHISTSADRASRLAQQLLILARLDPSVFKNVQHEPVDLNVVAKEATRELVTQSIAKNIDLGFEGSPVPVMISGDRSSLYELAINIIENAIFYTQVGGKVTVYVNINKNGAILIVEDNGPGIPKSERKQVFERFYRVLGTKVSGSGLGLAIVREIAETHQATVELNDGPSGIGTKVAVQFHQLDFTSPSYRQAKVQPSEATK